jgi:hypothetical protein
VTFYFKASCLKIHIQNANQINSVVQSGKMPK